jgi:hypothetical protein
MAAGGPKNLINDQQQRTIEVPSGLFQRIQENDELLNRIITGMQGVDSFTKEAVHKI